LRPIAVARVGNLQPSHEFAEVLRPAVFSYHELNDFKPGREHARRRFVRPPAVAAIGMGNLKRPLERLFGEQQVLQRTVEIAMVPEIYLMQMIAAGSRDPVELRE